MALLLLVNGSFKPCSVPCHLHGKTRQEEHRTHNAHPLWDAPPQHTCPCAKYTYTLLQNNSTRKRKGQPTQSAQYLCWLSKVHAHTRAPLRLNKSSEKHS